MPHHTCQDLLSPGRRSAFTYDSAVRGQLRKLSELRLRDPDAARTEERPSEGLNARHGFRISGATWNPSRDRPLRGEIASIVCGIEIHQAGNATLEPLRDPGHLFARNAISNENRVANFLGLESSENVGCESLDRVRF